MGISSHGLLGRPLPPKYVQKRALVTTGLRIPKVWRKRLYRSLSLVRICSGMGSFEVGGVMSSTTSHLSVSRSEEPGKAEWHTGGSSGNAAALWC